MSKWNHDQKRVLLQYALDNEVEAEDRSMKHASEVGGRSVKYVSATVNRSVEHVSDLRNTRETSRRDR
jgi:hypothetical protein